MKLWLLGPLETVVICFSMVLFVIWIKGPGLRANSGRIPSLPCLAGAGSNLLICPKP